MKPDHKEMEEQENQPRDKKWKCVRGALSCCRSTSGILKRSDGSALFLRERKWRVTADMRAGINAAGAAAAFRAH